MDLESDSDDDLLLKAPSVLKKPSRAETRKAVQAENYLEDLFTESERQAEQTRLLSQLMKQESGLNDKNEEDELLHRSIQLSKEAAQNSKSSNLARQRDMEDALLGILEDDQVLLREERIKRQRAITTDLTFQLGLRSQILSFDPQNVLVVFDNEEEAQVALENILNECNESDSCVQSMRRACSENFIFDYVNRNRYFRTQLAEGSISDENPAIVQWLYSAAISPRISSLVADRTLLSTIAENGCILNLNDVKTFSKSLTCWIAPDPSQNEKPRKNVVGLRNFLVIWQHILLHAPIIDDLDESNALDILSLIRISLDEAIGSHDEFKRNDRDTERTVFDHLQRIFAILIEKTTSRYQNSCHAETWMQKIADALIFGLKGDLGPSSAHIEDDPNTWLAYAASLRLFETYKKGFTGCSMVQQTKTWVAVKMSSLLLAWDNLEDNINKRLLELGMESIAKLVSRSLCWKAISIAYLGFLEVDSQGDNIAKDATRTLATLHCLEMSYECGIHMLESWSPGVAGVGTEYGSKEQAKLLLEVCFPMDKIVSRMSTRLRKLATNAYIERADYFLMIFHHYNFHILSKITNYAELDMGEVHAKKKQQTKMSTFFAKKPILPHETSA